MFESGYARGVNAAVAALPGFSWPGDLSPARAYLGDDLVPAATVPAPTPPGPDRGAPRRPRAWGHPPIPAVLRGTGSAGRSSMPSVS